VTISPTATPIISGAFYQDLFYTAPMQGVVINVYQVNATGARTGGAVTTTVTDAAGNFALYLAQNTTYELEANIPALGTTEHFFMPATTAAVSGVSLTYPITDPGTLSAMPDGAIFLLNNAGPLQATDIIKVDGGANINSAALNDGGFNINLIGEWPGGPQLYTYIMTVTASASPGTEHTVTYQAATRVVRVFPDATADISVAVFY